VHTVDDDEAKKSFSWLLKRVARGESVTIEKHGVPVAVMSPVDPSWNAPVVEAIAELKEYRFGNRLDGVSIRELSEDRRR